MWVPSPKELVARIACPALFRATLPRDATPSKNWILPVGFPPADVTDSPAVKLTLEPTNALALEVVSPRAVVPGDIVTLVALEVDVRNGSFP